MDGCSAAALGTSLAEDGNQMKSMVINKTLGVLSPRLITRYHHSNKRSAVRDWVNDRDIFLHVPKAGGTSIAAAFGRPDPGHFTLSEMLALRDTGDMPRSAFAVLRDPVERLVSTYEYLRSLHDNYGTSTVPQVLRYDTFDGFVRGFISSVDVEQHYFFRPVGSIIQGDGNIEIFLINFKGLTDTFSLFSSEVLGRALQLPHANVGRKAHVAGNELSGTSLEIVQEQYAADYRLVNWLGDKAFASTRRSS